MKKVLNFLALFSSMGTLLCCALPATLVAIGAGSVMAGLVSNVPGLVWLSVHKVELFIFAGIMLIASYAAQQKSKALACPIDPELNAVCAETKNWNKIILSISFVIYLIGAFFAFIAPIIF